MRSSRLWIHCLRSRGPYAVRQVVALAVLAALGGCATPPEPVAESVGKTLSARGVGPATLLGLPAEGREVRDTVIALAGSPLMPDTAARIALVNNRELRAALSAARYAEADVIQAAKLPNPTLAASTRWPSGGGPVTNTLSASFDVLDVFLIPLRKRMANEALGAAEQTAAHRALTLMSDVQTAWYRLATFEEWRARIAAYHAEDLARLAGMEQAGKLTLAHAKQQEGESREELARADAAVAAARERLNVLMGFAEAPRWILAGSAPSASGPRPNPPVLEQKALLARLDLAASRAEAKLIQEAYDLEKDAVVASRRAIGRRERT